jgi:hypothetical protein
MIAEDAHQGDRPAPAFGVEHDAVARLVWRRVCDDDAGLAVEVAGTALENRGRIADVDIHGFLMDVAESFLVTGPGALPLRIAADRPRRAGPKR